MLRKRAVAAALAALLSPIALGLGLGTVKTRSALNEPFDARIEIVGATLQDFDALTVKLADTGQFNRAGVARDAVLLNLRFEVVSAEAGADYVRITTKDPVREPFLNFLLELDWANGRMVREYTVLLDPPLYDRNRQKPLMTVPTPAPSVASVQAPPLQAPSPAPAPASNTAPAIPAQASTPAAPPSDGTIGAVQANDTAWGIALAHRPDRSISVQQMMLALLRANPAAFINENVNQLRRGAILRMPSHEEMDSLGPRDAVDEFQRQHQRWQEYRQGTASAALDAPIGAPDTTPSADAESVMGGDQPPADDARLELAAPADGDMAKTPEGAAGGSLDETLAKEDLDVRAHESTDLQAKLAEADQIIDLLQRQVQIKDEELAALQARLGATSEQPAQGAPAAGAEVTPTAPSQTAAEEPVVAPQPPVESEVETSEVVPVMPPTESDADTSPPETAEPLPAPPAAGATIPQEPSTQATGLQATLNNFVPAHWRAAVPGGALTVLGIASTLVLLLLIGISRALAGRRENAIVSTKTAAALAAVAPSIAAPTVAPDMLATREDLTRFEGPKADSEQFLRTMESSAEQLRAAPEEDLLEEVNVYLAYERFDQAEELVTKVIAQYPYEYKYRLRLLEIYYSANNKQAYEDAARELHAAVGDGDPLWESALAMWSEMSPERALFAPGADIEVGSSSDSDTASAFVDITGDDTTGGSTVSMPAGGDNMLSSTQVGLTNDYVGTTTLDFDLGDGLAGETLPPALDLDVSEQDRMDADFIDLTATTENVALDQMLDLTAGMAPSDGGPDHEVFDIAGDDFLQANSLEPLDVTKTGLVALDAGQTPLDATSPRSTAQPDRAEAATINAVADDLSLGFDISDTVAPAAHANLAQAATELDDDLGLDFNIEGLAGEAPVAQRDAGLDHFDLTLDSDLESAMSEAAGADLELSLPDGMALDFDLGEPTSALPAIDSEVEFDLALQDTTDFENLLIDDTLELPRSNAARSGMRQVDAPSESLEDLTRSMEASIAGLDLDDGDGDNILDLALEPGGSDSIDLDFGLDDIGELDELDTLALDPEALRRAAGATDKAVALGDDQDNEYQIALDETDTKLNLAKAYIELGDGEGARTILNEVIANGAQEQQDEARRLLAQLS